MIRLPRLSLRPSGLAPACLPDDRSKIDIVSSLRATHYWISLHWNSTPNGVHSRSSTTLKTYPACGHREFTAGNSTSTEHYLSTRSLSHEHFVHTFSISHHVGKQTFEVLQEHHNEHAQRHALRLMTGIVDMHS
ncbi:uncharacterized protein K489DRAFT_146013 [Dissoconium aciculare CBS 342.82]|uniref:Uncharacterized protein n=1 Tax=Dissoconium aciculare CBS 342.82 TaxID=1314786 RepID=A0A6J3MDP7_9PEZI|nr:uncharacterized protein K489DRAFT_146013 [Dissoconium aciculare CBS 342.82]KAF1824972.1 hypothetical protein K489DRAFT_146013 [Dissoconium aciculare CBS 342.82]